MTFFVIQSISICYTDGKQACSAALWSHYRLLFDSELFADYILSVLNLCNGLLRRGGLILGLSGKRAASLSLVGKRLA